MEVTGAREGKAMTQSLKNFSCERCEELRTRLPGKLTTTRFIHAFHAGRVRMTLDHLIYRRPIRGHKWDYERWWEVVGDGTRYIEVVLRGPKMPHVGENEDIPLVEEP